MSGKDIFANVVQSPVATSAGPVDLPILYRDGSSLLVGMVPTRPFFKGRIGWVRSSA